MDILNSIIPAVITGFITLAGVIFSTNKKQGIIETKLEHLTEEVRKHNNFAERLPVVEEKIKVINHRIENIEEKVK